MLVNPTKLTKELTDAGIPMTGCDDQGTIYFLPEATDEQKALAQTIVLNHNPVWYVDERKAEYPALSDEVDSIYKTFKYLRDNGMVLGADGDAWVNLIISIKNKYPKT